MSDAIFNSTGDVNGGSGRIASAWLGPGASAAPTMANILSAAGITPTQTVERHLPTYTYNKPAPVDYQAIAAQARADAQSILGGLAEANYQRNLLENAKKWVNDINTSGDLNNSWKQAYRAGNYGLGGLALARHNYDTAKAGLDGLTANEKAWLASQGVNVPSKYPAF